MPHKLKISRSRATCKYWFEQSSFDRSRNIPSVSIDPNSDGSLPEILLLLRSSRPSSAKQHRFVSANGARAKHKLLHDITYEEQVEDQAAKEEDLTKSWLGERYLPALTGHHCT